jgi:hypothetical protein
MQLDAIDFLTLTLESRSRTVDALAGIQPNAYSLGC